MIVTDCLPQAKAILGGHYTENAESLGCVIGDELVAVATYDNWNGTSMYFSIWAAKKPSKEWSRAIFEYPFDQIGVKKLIGLVNSTNEKSIKLALNSGFELEGTIKNTSEEGDTLIFTMTRDQCKVLRWEIAA